MTPACMTPEELALWWDANLRAKTITPCFDCPLGFALEMRAEGCCNGEPGGLLRTPKAENTSGRQGIRYDSDEERMAARRATWRESKRRDRARKALA